MLKPEIHDPQGEAIAAACQRLGFGQVLGVRQGKRFEVEISGPAGADEVGQIRALAAELLANPVIEEFSVHAPESVRILSVTDGGSGRSPTATKRCVRPVITGVQGYSGYLREIFHM